MEYPRFEGDIRLEYPNITECQTGDSFPCPDTYVKVQSVEMPEFDVKQNQYIKELPPQQINGVWTQVFEIKVLSVEELAQIEVYKKETKRMQDLLFPEISKDLNKSGSAPNVVG